MLGVIRPALFCGVFALYVWTASPALGWLDSPEFVAQSLQLGVAHSPGHPLPALVGRLGGMIPIGDLVWRVNLMSALAAALAVTVLFSMLERLFQREDRRRGARWHRVLAASLALVCAFSLSLWSNAVRAEVYALQTLLTLCALAAFVEYLADRRARSLMTTAFFAGLALANHHLMALLVVIPAAVAVFWTRRASRPSARTCLATAAMGLLGTGVLLYLPLRSAAHPEVNFGAPHTLERFWWTLSGSAFAKSATADRASSHFVDSLQVADALADALTLPVLLFALGGLIAGLRRQETRGLAGFCAAVALLTAIARVLLGFDPETPDHHAYLLPGILALIVLAAIACVELIRWMRRAEPVQRRAGPIAALAFALLVPLQLSAQWHRVDRSQDYSSSEMARWELAALPPRALVLSGYFETRFRSWALHAVEGMRPDVSLLDRSFLTYPGAAAEARRRHPELAPLIDAPLRAGKTLPVAELKAIGQRRPILVQLHINLSSADRPWLVPSGPFAAFAPTPPHSDWRAQITARDFERRDELAAISKRASPAETHDVLKALLWHDVTRLEQYCNLGDRPSAQRVLQGALRLAPQDATLLELARACRLELPGPDAIGE